MRSQSILFFFATLLFSGQTSARSLEKRDEICWFTGGGPVGVGDALCTGSDGEAHEDILSCPTPGVAERICGADDVDAGVRDNCKKLDGTGTYCTVGGKTGTPGGHYVCYCINGNFCCDHPAEVPGGKHPRDYFKEGGCSCGKRL
ncbi:hypothetical protein PG991_009343 [Apiospora marii]|uniref:Uncharacterized protein n=1 Tax=Apiospora marii TaxID=335849 RepID=A0ABR1RKC4_9PEZI